MNVCKRQETGLTWKCLEASSGDKDIAFSVSVLVEPY